MELLQNGTLTAGHARPLLTLDPAVAVKAAKQIAEQGLSVRQAEQLAKQLAKPAAEPKVPTIAPTFHREMEIALKDSLSRRVKVVSKGNGKGELVLEFYSDDELRELGAKLTK